MKNVKQTSTDDPNAAVLINENGLCTYGKLPEDAVGELSKEELQKINRRLADTSGSMDDLRTAASEVLQDLGYGSVQWPLPDDDMARIKAGRAPEGLLLTHIETSARPSGIQNGQADG